MRFFKKIAGILGLGKDDAPHSANDEHKDPDSAPDDNDQVDVEPIPGPRKGFSVPVKVATERPSLGPVVVTCSGDGGVQGLNWYIKRLRIDEEGDVADEFLDETTEGERDVQPLPRFQIKYTAQPAKVREQVLTRDGKLQQCVESQGRLQWV
ncbi:hypothetical protein Dimus_008394 [Dionaea muscipula]